MTSVKIECPKCLYPIWVQLPQFEFSDARASGDKNYSIYVGKPNAEYRAMGGIEEVQQWQGTHFTDTSD